MDPETRKALEYAERLYTVALGVMAAARADIKGAWNRDPKIITLAVYGRSLSIYKAALVLMDANQTIEARMLARPLYENLLWLAALLERKEAFVAEMLEDEALNRRTLGQTAMRLTVLHGGDPNSPDSITLRGYIRQLAQAYHDPKRLHADKVAGMGKLGLHYADYARLSLDCLHCSITALGRHVESQRESQTRTTVTLNVEPRVTDRDRLTTVLLLCRAIMGAAIAANETVGFSTGGPAVGALVKEFEDNGWATLT